MQVTLRNKLVFLANGPSGASLTQGFSDFSPFTKKHTALLSNLHFGIAFMVWGLLVCCTFDTFDKSMQFRHSHHELCKVLVHGVLISFGAMLCEVCPTAIPVRALGCPGQLLDAEYIYIDQYQCRKYQKWSVTVMVSIRSSSNLVNKRNMNSEGLGMELCPIWMVAHRMDFEEFPSGASGVLYVNPTHVESNPAPSCSNKCRNSDVLPLIQRDVGYAGYALDTSSCIVPVLLPAKSMEKSFCAMDSAALTFVPCQR